MKICCLSSLECGPVPNVMAVLPIIGGALCSMPQSLADRRALLECRAITLFLVRYRRRIPCRCRLIIRPFITCLHNKWHLDPCSRLATVHMDRKIGALPEPPGPFFGVGGSPSNTKSPGQRHTSIPSGIQVHPAIWVQRAWVGGCVCRGGKSYQQPFTYVAV